MLIGIDVGGTFTDGVLFDGRAIIAAVKKPTDNQDLKSTLLQVLDSLLTHTHAESIRRIVLSTTRVTNLLATDSGDPTALVLIPGPGLPLDTYRLFPDTFFLGGSIDFRGRKTESLARPELKNALDLIETRAITKIGVVGKFSNRSNELEKEVQDEIALHYPETETVLGSETAGQLNFLRRITTTYYTAMTRSLWRDFIEQIESALAERGIKAEVDVLKADGGTLPLGLSGDKPCETVFSGPAASTMGAVALADKPRNSVVIDIGGTTSDISLLMDGQPLYASKGARIQGHNTHISAFSVYSLPLGGDSPITIDSGQIKIGKLRQGRSACLGGEYPTVTDVFNHKYGLGIGDQNRSAQQLQAALADTGITMDSLLSQVEDKVLGALQNAVLQMYKEWEEEPAYRVWEVVNGRQFVVQEIIGIGAASEAIVPILARRMGVEHFIPEYAAVANAIGACVARPTLALKLHADTQNGYFTIDQDGIRGKLPSGSSMQMKDACELARQQLTSLARARGMEDYAEEAQIYLEEQFNVIRGWSTSGKIFDVGIQIAPGFIKDYQGVKR